MPILDAVSAPDTTVAPGITITEFLGDSQSMKITSLYYWKITPCIIRLITLLPDVGILFCCGGSFVLVGDCLSSLVLVLPTLHSGDVHKQALISSSSFAIFVREHWSWGLIGLSTGPSSILDGTKQSITSPKIWKFISPDEMLTQV